MATIIIRQYVKYQMQFADIDGKLYRVNIYDETDADILPATIQLTAGERPLYISENNSDNIYEPIRTQTGRIEICTLMPDGSRLQLNDILPSTNTSSPVRVEHFTNGAWDIVWLGFLKCEMYNQAYVGTPENISLPIISILEAWKSVYINRNKVETGWELLVELMSEQIGNYFVGLGGMPIDGSDFLDKYINTSIFVKKKEYMNEENTLYELKGSSAYSILYAICKFLGWTAREEFGYLFFEVVQGYGQIENTVTRNMSELDWRGIDHQRSIRQGRRLGIISANLDLFDIETELGEIPYGDFHFEIYHQIGNAYLQTSYRPWIYFLPSSNTKAYSNMSLRFYAGEIKVGIQYDPNYLYDFRRIATPIDVDDVIETCIPYANMNSQAFNAYYYNPTEFSELYAGAFFVRMQKDEPTEPTIYHEDTKDGILACLFPGAWKQNTAYTQPIFEMRSVQAFASFADGYIDIETELLIFTMDLNAGIRQSSMKLAMDLQIGDKVWNGNTWVDANGNTGKFLVPIDISGEKLQGNWNGSMDIDRVDGHLIPTFYMAGTEKKRVMGAVTLRIYPETYIPNIESYDRQWFECNIFFSKLSINYFPKKSEKQSDRGTNTYISTINLAFEEEVDIDTVFASWHNNNPSPSLFYNEDKMTPAKYLKYLKQDGTSYKSQRPEINLLERMNAFYKKPRTILELEVRHIEDMPLPMLRLNGLGDGKVYAPVAERRDFRTNVSRITCIELPQE